MSFRMLPAPARAVSTAGTLAAVALGLVVGCGGSGAPGSGEDGGKRPPILVLGVDGLEWDVVLPMLAAGRLPNLAGLIERGSYGELATLVPTLSPVIWTSIATGKGREAHGIHGFARTGDSGAVELYDNADRRTKALWNIASDYDRSVWVIGWWVTFPVEPVNGVMVAQTNTVDQVEIEAGRNLWKGTLLRALEGQVHPPERQAEILAVLEEVDRELPQLTERIFGRFPHAPAELGELARRLWENTQWAFRADATYLRVATDLAREGPLPELTLLYLGGPDVVGHRFWRYRRPELYTHKPSAAELESFSSVIEDYYAYVDEALGRLLGAWGAETDVFVISDHGMKAVNLEARFDPDDPPRDVNSGDHQDAPPGVLIAAGPSIRVRTSAPAATSLSRGELGVVGNVLDLAPTLLALLEIPIGRDFEGWALGSLLAEGKKSDPGEIASHDDAAFRAGRRELAASRPEAERLEQLRALGYLGDN